MRYVLLSLFGLAFAASAGAVDRANLDYRLGKLGLKFEAMQAKPDKRIPAETLRQARGIILLDRTKAGFLFAYQGGSGVVMARDPMSGHWSPPAFLSANEASLGFQIGGEQSFMVILLMHTNALQNLEQGHFSFGGEATGTAGNAASAVRGDIASGEPLTLVYTDREGLYGGATIKGDAISSDANADVAYYGQYVSMDEILFGQRVKLTPAAEDLIRRIDQFSR